jgi:hypothetical protein
VYEQPGVGWVILEQLLATIKATGAITLRKMAGRLRYWPRNDATLYLCKCPPAWRISTREGSDAAVQLLLPEWGRGEIARYIQYYHSTFRLLFG